jgi:hypothetical protein
MELITYNQSKVITKNITSIDTGIITLYENTGEQNTIPNTQLLSINTFIKNLKAYSKITSLAVIDIPEIGIDDSDTDQILKVLNAEWGGERIHLDLLIGQDENWLMIGAISLLNAQGYPYRNYNLMEQYTDNIAIELGINGKIGVRTTDVGYGNLQSNDVLTIYGSYTEEIVITPTLELTSTLPFTKAITTTSSTILAANENRKYVAVTNYSNQDIFLNLGSTAYLNQGICLSANGGSYELITSQVPYFGVISGIANASANLSGLESI